MPRMHNLVLSPPHAFPQVPSVCKPGGPSTLAVPPPHTHTHFKSPSFLSFFPPPRYAQFVDLVDACSRDNLEFVKNKAATTMYELLR